MITKVVLAKLSPTMDEGTVVKWTRGEGDAVKVGDVLAEIETDKANMEMEALGAGILRKILVPAGGKAPVGALIGVIADAGEDLGALLSEASSAAPAAGRAPAPAVSAPAAAETAPPPPQTAPAAPPPAAAAPDAPAPPAHAETETRADGGRVKASPLARSMAAQRNIPLTAINGSGPGGRIIKRDIEAWGGAPAAAATATAPTFAARPTAVPTPAPAAPAVTPGQEIPLSNMRKTIARRLVESKFSAPHFYVTVEIDMDAAAALRADLAAVEAKLSYNDLVVRACALALARFPTVNASWGGDKIVTHADVNVGVAVALPDGLITPVVRNADRKSVGQIAAEIRDLAGRAREKKIKPDEYTGSTFTVSNLGMYDVTEFTAIINPPDAAILAVGAVREQPVVKDGALAVGRRMKVTLSADHRVVDGALAAQFLAEARRLLEHPLLLLV
jgi:pyruvate dehydrogenase E2 component (dihydrolipoamide acetyltransferase)